MLKFYITIGVGMPPAGHLGISSLNRPYSTKRLTNAERESFSVSPDLHPIIIGNLLGDLHINKQRNNSRLVFKQGLINKGYIYHLFELFSSYSNMEVPKHYEFFDKRSNKSYTSIVFNTYSLPCFNYYYNLFYLENIKIIPLNIGELLTSEGLAYWAMDDGCKSKNAFYLNTDSFTLDEVELLIKVLKQNFDLNCTHQIRGINQYRIYIKTDSMKNFRFLVTPHFHSSMMYKLTV